jgi:hypothetical protein
MAIVSSEVWKTRNRGNGRLAVFEKHTDHTGEVHEHRYSAPAGHDTAQELLNWVPVLESNLIEAEKNEIQSSIENGADPETITTKHLTGTQKAKRVVKALMLGSPEKMLKAAEYVQGFTNTQIDNIFTQAQRVRIRERQNYILNNQSVFVADLREEL